MKKFLTLFILLLFNTTVYAKSPDKPTNLFYDPHDYISQEVENELSNWNKKSSNLEHNPQLAIIVEDKLDESIEEYSLRTAQNWEVGTDSNGNGVGVLLTIVIEQRQTKLQVSNDGLFYLSDSESNAILDDEQFKTFMRSEEYSKGVSHIIKLLTTKLEDSSMLINSSKSLKESTNLKGFVSKSTPFLFPTFVIFFCSTFAMLFIPKEKRTIEKQSIENYTRYKTASASRAAAVRNSKNLKSTDSKDYLAAHTILHHHHHNHHNSNSQTSSNDSFDSSSGFDGGGGDAGGW